MPRVGILTSIDVMCLCVILRRTFATNIYMKSNIFRARNMDECFAKFAIPTCVFHCTTKSAYEHSFRPENSRASVKGTRLAVPCNVANSLAGNMVKS